VASSVQQHIAGILARDFSEGEIGKVSLAGSEAHGGLQFVRLFYHVKEGADRAKIERALEAASPKIRRELGAVMNQKFVPEIRFVYDATLESAARVEEILEKLK